MKTEFTEMRRDWMSVGREYWEHEYYDAEEGLKLSKKVFEKAIDGMKWVKISDQESFPMCQGLALKELIKEFRMPYVSLVSYDCLNCAPYGFYGLEGFYENGRVRLHVLDTGTRLVPICADHFPDNGEALAEAKKER